MKIIFEWLDMHTDVIEFPERDDVAPEPYINRPLYPLRDWEFELHGKDNDGIWHYRATTDPPPPAPPSHGQGEL